jgi:gliding motility-associated lipoprotein GldH
MRLQRLVNRICRGLGLVLIGIFASCQYDALYDQYQIIENTVWEKDKEYYFTFLVDDIDIPYDLTLDVRNNNLYPYQNFGFFM